VDQMNILIRAALNNGRIALVNYEEWQAAKNAQHSGLFGPKQFRDMFFLTPSGWVQADSDITAYVQATLKERHMGAVQRITFTAGNNTVYIKMKDGRWATAVLTQDGLTDEIWHD